MNNIQYSISIDNLSLVGNVKNKLHHQKLRQRTYSREWTTPNQLYHYNYSLIGGGFLQVGHDTETTPRVRLEFNPNKVSRKDWEREHLQILKSLKDVHLTRRDIAVDLYHVDMNDFRIVDQLGRKRNEYRTGTGKLETLYLGAQTSEERIRIYNKAVEQKLKTDFKWWRVEAQLRNGKDQKANVQEYNPFRKIKFVKKGSNGIKDWKDRAVIKLLEEEPDVWAEMNKKTRAKYKKLMAEQTESVEVLDVAGLFGKQMEKLEIDVRSWIDFTADDDIHWTDLKRVSKL